MLNGRPPFEPTDAQRTAVMTLAACGTRHEIIARHVGVDPKTLRRHFRSELREGRKDANALVARTLFAAAIRGSLTAIIWWEKTRAGMRETTHLEHSGPGGKALEPPRLGISFIDGGPGLPVVHAPGQGLLEIISNEEIQS